MDIWSLYQIGPKRNPIEIHVINKTIVFDNDFIYLKYSYFQAITNTPISVKGEVPIILELSSFIGCSDPTSNGCFRIDINGTASASLYGNFLFSAFVNDLELALSG